VQNIAVTDAVTRAEAGYSSMCFSSESLRPIDRVPFFRDFVGRVLARIDIEPLGARFCCDACLWRLPGLSISAVSGSAVRATRTREMAEGNDNLALVINLQGGATFSQFGRDATIRPGSAVLISDADPSCMVRMQSRSLSIHVPRAVLTPMLSHPDAMLMAVMPRSLEALRLLIGYVDLLTRDRTSIATAELQHLAADHVHDLIAMTIGATRDSAEIAAGRGLRAARMRAIKADIVRNLASGNVTADALAGRHGVSARYIRKLFESENTSLSQFVLRQRLAQVRRMLTDPRNADRTISEIAFATGFGDLSTFNREFRRRFAMTPSDMRRNTH
jgi:AraC-like DNA-binding protein